MKIEADSEKEAIQTAKELLLSWGYKVNSKPIVMQVN